MDSIVLTTDLREFLQDLKCIGTDENQIMATEDYSNEQLRLIYEEIFKKGYKYVTSEEEFDFSTDFIFETSKNSPEIYFSRGIYNKNGSYMGEIELSISCSLDYIIIDIEQNSFFTSKRNKTAGLINCRLQIAINAYSPYEIKIRGDFSNHKTSINSPLYNLQFNQKAEQFLVVSSSGST